MRGILDDLLIILLLAGLLTACGVRRVSTLPKTCSAGQEVVHEHGEDCESRCTCTRDGNWNCRHQPCMAR